VPALLGYLIAFTLSIVCESLSTKSFQNAMIYWYYVRQTIN